MPKDLEGRLAKPSLKLMGLIRGQGGAMAADFLPFPIHSVIYTQIPTIHTYTYRYTLMNIDRHGHVNRHAGLLRGTWYTHTHTEHRFIQSSNTY